MRIMADNQHACLDIFYAPRSPDGTSQHSGLPGTARIPNAPMAAERRQGVICLARCRNNKQRAEAVWRKNGYVRLNGN
jgi:hypothetical protein